MQKNQATNDINMVVKIDTIQKLLHSQVKSLILESINKLPTVGTDYIAGYRDALDQLLRDLDNL